MASQTWSDWGRAKAPEARQNHNQPSTPLSILLLYLQLPRGDDDDDDDARAHVRGSAER